MAYKLLLESIAASRAYGQQGELGRHLATLGYAARGRGNRAEAGRHFHGALQLGHELGAKFPTWWALPGIALLLHDDGETERALEIYCLATRYPVIGNSRWFQDLAGQQITAAAGLLPPKVAIAAQERGQDRDLDATMAELEAGWSGACG